MQRLLLTCFLATFVVAGAQGGEIYTNNVFSSDTAFNAATGGTAFEPYGVEGRIGNNQLNGTYEYGINGLVGPVPGTFQFGISQGQRTWTNGQATAFSLKYFGDTGPYAGKIEWSIGGSPVLTTTASYFDVSDLYIRTRSAANSSIVVDNLVLNGNAAPGTAKSQAIGAATDYLRISEANFRAGYTLTGNVTMSWTGSAPTNSNLAFQIKGIQAVPEPGTLAMAGLGAVLIAGTSLRRWRSRREA